MRQLEIKYKYKMDMGNQSELDDVFDSFFQKASELFTTVSGTNLNK